MGEFIMNKAGRIEAAGPDQAQSSGVHAPLAVSSRDRWKRTNADA